MNLKESLDVIRSQVKSTEAKKALNNVEFCIKSLENELKDINDELDDLEDELEYIIQGNQE